MENEKTMKETLKEIRKNKRNRYPVVMKSKNRLYVIYEKRVESYNLDKVETKKELDGDFKDTEEKEWTPEIEIEMCIGSGLKRVRDTTEENDWRFK